MKNSLVALAVALASFGAVAGPVSTLTLDGFEYAPGVNGMVRYSGQNVSAGVGALNATFTEPGPFGDTTSFLAFCVDLAHSAASFGVAIPYSAYPAFQNTLSVPFEDLGRLFTYNDLTNDGTLNGNGLTSLNIRDSAAMQLAVWELVYENSPSSVLGGSGFEATSPSLIGNGISTKANSLIAGALGTTTNMYDITYFSDDAGSKNRKGGFQNFVTGTFNENLGIGNPTPVPEPETYALMMAGLGAMFFVSRRRKNGERK